MCVKFPLSLAGLLISTPQAESRSILFSGRTLVQQNGVTLIELILSIVIISISITGMYSGLASLSKNSTDPMLRVQALAIAESYLEEVSLRAFGTGCPASGGSRSEFQFVCDYNGLSDSSVKDQYGNVVAGLESYSVAVQVAANSGLGPSGSMVPLASALLITVTVTDPTNRNVVLHGFRTNYN